MDIPGYYYGAEPNWASIDDGDLGAAAWAGAAVNKGHVPFYPSFETTPNFANIPCLYVSGDDHKTGLGVAYATRDEESLVGNYIPMDDDHGINFDRELLGPVLITEMISCPQMSSIKYHKPTHKILLTSRERHHSCGVYCFSPPLSAADDAQPHWLLGEANQYQRISLHHRLRDDWVAYRSTPAPPSSDLICVIGTNAGIIRVRSDDSMAWIAPQNQALSRHVPQDIFDLDFQHSNHNVVMAGGRQARLWITDLRTPELEWTDVRHGSSIAHVRSVNPHQILVAGLKNTMALYDMRFFSQRPNGVRPLLSFATYRNEAHFHTGWDVSPDLGIVAAAHDDGTVKLFSLRSGRMLRSDAMDRIYTQAPVKALMFQQMPTEKLPSLWVGVGPSIQKFTFGAHGMHDEA
ncbi:WD40 repeat-like-containing domain protein [Ophiocordyceps sinensis CO18]|uniref:WD40 repeat-like-containing domain protein n=1 Tax=Ophiocordyceps sinensis (strain Co18 / CGMCC 3.14243) TaxID=911162 RepID=T5AGI8_OPHSC|nr:WD40 repeat-like-containing domain protein [Ophiocordyceps sinensis CO18]